MAVETGSFTHDGTQPPPPPLLYPDPLAGLVTGESSGGTDPVSAYSDEFDVPIAKPVEIDAEAVQAMVDAALADEPQEEVASRAQHADPAYPVGSGQPFLPAQRGPSGQAMPGMLPPAHRTRPTGQQAWQALRAYPRPGAHGIGGGQPRLPLRSKPSKTSTGIIVAIILLAVFGLIAIQLIAAVIEGISSTFE
ncbi:MAG: hypothetical protein ACRDQ7_26300 [Haloechinothrix sp.]